MAQPYGKTQIEIGYVISRTFATVAANFPVFLLLSLLFAAVPAILVGYLTQVVLLPFMLASPDPSSYLGTVYLLQIGAGLLMMLPTYVLIGALTHGSVVYLSGSKASLASCLGTGFSRSLPLRGARAAVRAGYGFLLPVADRAGNHGGRPLVGRGAGAGG